MDTLLDKVMQLIAVKLRVPGVPAHQGGAASHPARLRQTITALLQTETQLAELRTQLHSAQDAVTRHEHQAAELSAVIDSYLLAGDERRAAAGQQVLNRLRQQIQTLRHHSRRLAGAAERLQSELDRLEVKLMLLGVERQTLDAIIQRVRSQQRHTQSTGTWRVVEPE